MNDIVLGIQELKKVFDFILYIDLDIHHGMKNLFVTVVVSLLKLDINDDC